MDKLRKNILEISNNHYKYLMSLENVEGIGLGYKRINGINILEPCIHVLVKNKLDKKYINSNNLIPKTYMGIKTDVIKTGEFKINSGDVIPQIFRPLQGGCGISVNNSDDNNGTLGCIVTKVVEGKLEFYILSNNHVLADLNRLPIGTSVIQPLIRLGGSIQNDIVAHLSSFIQYKFIEGANEPENYVDCAIAKIVKNTLISNTIFGVGEIKGFSEVNLDEEVKKVGFKTGLTYGEVFTVGATEKINCGNGKKALFKNQIIAQIDSENGDSGAIVLNYSNEAIGLHFAGIDEDMEGNFAVINEITYVLDALGVEIYTG